MKKIKFILGCILSLSWPLLLEASDTKTLSELILPSPEELQNNHIDPKLLKLAIENFLSVGNPAIVRINVETEQVELLDNSGHIFCVDISEVSAPQPNVQL